MFINTRVRQQWRKVLLLIFVGITGLLILAWCNNYVSSYFESHIEDYRLSEAEPMRFHPIQLTPSTSEQLSWVERLKLDSEAVWLESKRRRNEAVEQIGPAFQRQPWSPHQGQSVFWNFFTPAYHCPRPVERIGGLGDGGKWICGFSHIATRKPPCIVYSYGISTEVTFETEILQLSNCSVFMYDHTIDVNDAHGGPAKLVLQYPGRAKLYKLGLGTVNNGPRPLRTLQAEMKRHNHTFIDILKIDIEGQEFDVLRSIIADYSAGLPFGQLQIEIHVTFTAGTAFNMMVEWFDLLETAGLRAFCSEPNLVAMHAEKLNFVNLMEYAFLNSKLDFQYYL